MPEAELEPGATRARARSAEPVAATERGGIVVIEDDPAYLDLLVRLLDRAGYAVTPLESALGAAGLVRSLRPDAVVLDLGLPYRSGAALMADLRADPLTSRVPIILLTGLPEVLPPEYRAMAAAVLTKPGTLSALLAVIDAARGAASGPRRE